MEGVAKCRMTEDVGRNNTLGKRQVEFCGVQPGLTNRCVFSEGKNAHEIKGKMKEGELRRLSKPLGLGSYHGL